ncbi:MAG: hypothetical protein JRE56_07300 [Deltaproteobacteria bacterium]|jgi:hypothetical protein|nr:hypothetical protein [Deltaproteobacteria bacterium]
MNGHDCLLCGWRAEKKSQQIIMIVPLQQANERVKLIQLMASSMALPIMICYRKRHGTPEPDRADGNADIGYCCRGV